VRPEVDGSLGFAIEGGRHPVVEQALKRDGQPFIANACDLSPGPAQKSGQIWLITGPNMAGKSTFLRQNALIALLAQIGSFVPATRARIGIVDRLFSRVGAADDLARGRSTFMVEMVETAVILNQASERSLVILDEIGRGTATFDGLSIAWAVAEYLHDSAEHCAKTLFATHYHELTELAERLPGAQNYQITATEREGEVVFLHRLERGRASKSYGIEVARLAGLPPAALVRAREVLQRLERYELDVFAEEGEVNVERATAVGATEPTSADAALTKAGTRAARRRVAAQASFFDLANQKVIDELREAKVEDMTAEEAKDLITELRKKLL
jgi:DNA mismatch repair protein MutS